VIVTVKIQVTEHLKHSIENCGQTAADRDMVLKAYRKLPPLYPMAIS